MNGVIERIRVYPIKGEAGRELAEARLIENSGIEGDRHAHAKGGEKQLSLLLLVENRERQEEKGLCFARFRENITIRASIPVFLAPGARIDVGETALEITAENKHCHDECAVYRTGKTCTLVGRKLFAKVLKGGVISLGESVSSL